MPVGMGTPTTSQLRRSVWLLPHCHLRRQLVFRLAHLLVLRWSTATWWPRVCSSASWRTRCGSTCLAFRAPVGVRCSTGSSTRSTTQAVACACSRCAVDAGTVPPICICYADIALAVGACRTVWSNREVRCCIFAGLCCLEDSIDVDRSMRHPHGLMAMCRLVCDHCCGMRATIDRLCATCLPWIPGVLRFWLGGRVRACCLAGCVDSFDAAGATVPFEVQRSWIPG